MAHVQGSDDPIAHLAEDRNEDYGPAPPADTIQASASRRPADGARVPPGGAGMGAAAQSFNQH